MLSLKQKRASLIPLILEGKEIKVEVYDFACQEAGGCNTEPKLTKVLSGWFANAVYWIEGEKRDEEFKDILPILRRSPEVRFVKHTVNVGSQKSFTNTIYNMLYMDGSNPFAKSKSDLILVKGLRYELVKKICTSDACASVGINGPMMILMSSKDTLPSSVVDLQEWEEAGNDYDEYVLGHEIGHTFGLQDQYAGRYEKNLSKYRSKKQPKYSVMLDGWMAADDADGLGNVIDQWIIYALQKQYPDTWGERINPRVRNGWYSLDYDEKTLSSMDYYTMGTSESLLSKLPMDQQQCSSVKPQTSKATKKHRSTGKSTGKKKSATRSGKKKR